MTAYPRRRKEDKRTGRVLTFFYRFFFMIGVAAFISGFFMALTISHLVSYTPPSLPDDMMLTYTFKSDLAEVINSPSITQPLLRPATTLNDVITALDSAATDNRVKGFVAKIEEIKFTVAQIQELRESILRFRAAGKFAHVYADSLGGFSGGMGDYYLASAFDKIWIQPVGVVAMGGIAAEVPFVKEALGKLGVFAEFAHRGKFKSAPETLTETGMSAAHREMMQSIVNDLSDQMIEGMAQGRKIDVAEMKKRIDEGPYTETQALDLKLIDAIGYYEDVLVDVGYPVADVSDEAKKAKKKDKSIATGPEAVRLTGYAFVEETRNQDKGISGFLSNLMRREAPLSANRDKAKIALIFGNGEIIPFRPRTQAAFGEGAMEADKIVEAFKSAQRDPDVAAIVFRIDSPGGAPSAAETIRRVIIDTQKKGKPVIVSMSSYAASGGYWIAAPADKIVAQPGTLTGSIGVFGGKFVLAGLWDKLGVRFDTVTAGKRAGMWSANRTFTPEEFKKFDAMLGHVYDAFLERVADGRKMTIAEVEALAQGRVYTGRQAKDLGLVDEIGGLDRAVALAREAAKLPLEQDVPVTRFPPRKSTLEMFISLATEGAFFKPEIDIRAEDVLQAMQKAAAPPENILRMPTSYNVTP